jgi:hypothetical protein
MALEDPPLRGGQCRPGDADAEEPHKR